MSTNYLTEHTIGSIISGAFKIYFQNFATIFLIYILPMAFLQLVLNLTALSLSLSENLALIILVLVLVLLFYFIAYFTIYAAITVTVSDICLENKPSLKRAYTYVFGKRFFQFISTLILQTLIIFGSTAIMILPGYFFDSEILMALAILPLFIFIFWFLLTPSVVILEAKSGVAALKRSKQLGDGSHWRNGGMLLVLIIVLGLIGGLIGLVSAFSSISPEHWVFQVFVRLIQEGLATPISLIAIVLIYYDRRARKDGYDVKALAEDLAR